MSSPLLFLIASLIWGSTFWAITLQLGQAAPGVSVACRFLLASATLFALCLRRGDRLRLPWATQRWLMLQGAFHFCLSYVFTYASEQYLVSALVGVLFALIVFWNPILTRIVFGTPLTWRTLCAAAAAMCGIVLLFSRSLDNAWRNLPGDGGDHVLLGLALAVGATLCSAVGNVVVVKVRQHSPNVMLTMAWSMSWGSLMVVAWTLTDGQSWRLPSTPSYWLSLVYLSIFGSVIAFSAYFTLMHRIGSQKTVYISVATPVISVLLSMQLEGYRPGLIELAGMALCLSSVAWALRSGTPAATPRPSTRPLQGTTEAS